MPTANCEDFDQNWKAKVLSQFGDSTTINYRTHIRKHLVPFFGEYTQVYVYEVRHSFAQDSARPVLKGQ